MADVILCNSCSILRGCRAIDEKSLLIIEGKHCWFVHIDILVGQINDVLDIE